MNREEYKANLLLFFLSHENDIPKETKWIAIDDDSEVYVYWGEKKPYLTTGTCVEWHQQSGWVDHEYGFFDNVTFEFDAKTSLISIEELFDE
jgi:hypothetical protein